MATSCRVGTKGQGQEDEAEALSLCDLALEDEENQEAGDLDPHGKRGEGEFDFGSLCGSVLTEQEMCAADEVFFKGQILPLRLSVSSDRRSVSRSGSMDHSSSAGLASISSRSSSINSSSTSSSSKPYKPKLRNQFHTHPSPNPQLRTSGARTGNRSRRWSVWDFLRLGLVQTPEIELEGLKVRTKSFGCSNKDGVIKNLDSQYESKTIRRDGLSRSSGFLRGCKCSVETAPLDPVMVRSNSTSNNNSGSRRNAMQREVKKKKTVKQAMSRHRTFEWLKELSHATSPDHQIISS